MKIKLVLKMVSKLLFKSENIDIFLRSVAFMIYDVNVHFAH